MEYKNKEKTEGTKQQQIHRTQECTNSYQRERDWEDGWEGRDKGNKGALIITHNVGRLARGKQYNAEKTSSDSIASYYADGQ